MHDLDAYIQTFMGEKAKAMLNGDTVYQVQLPLLKPFRDKYTSCIGFYAGKKNQLPLYFKCFFTDEGAAGRDDYLQEIFRAVRYGDSEAGI